MAKKKRKARGAEGFTRTLQHKATRLRRQWLRCGDSSAAQLYKDLTGRLPLGLTKSTRRENARSEQE